MSDFASIIGGDGTQLAIADAPPEDQVFYSVVSDVDYDVDMGNEGDIWSGASGSGDNSVFGGHGDDSITTGTGEDLVGGEGGDDSISTGSGDDIATGGEGDDDIDLGDGDNLATGGNGGDVVTGGSGSDFLGGGSGDDVIDGGAGNDQLFGQSGDDDLDGGAGADRLFGQAGDDTLTGGEGSDSMWGGDGDDVFFFDSNFGNDVINDFAGGDSILLATDINGSGITSAGDLVSGGFVTGTATQTVITIGGDSITIKNVDVNEFIANINDYVKVQ